MHFKLLVMSHIVLTLFSGGHIIVIALVVVLLFGGKRIPEVMKGVGQGIKEFKDSMNDNNTTSQKQLPRKNDRNENLF